MITLLVGGEDGSNAVARVINAPDNWVEPGYVERDDWVELGFLNHLEFMIATVGVARVLWHEELNLRKVSAVVDAEMIAALVGEEREQGVRIVLDRVARSLPNQMLVYPVSWAEPVVFTQQDSQSGMMELGYAWVCWKYAGEGRKARAARLAKEDGR